MGLLKDKNFRIVLSILVMGVMGGSIVGPILPAMTGPLNVSKSTIGLVLSVYTIFALIFTPILGVMADRYGRRKILIPSLLAFGLTGSAIAITREFWLVLLFRAIQGIAVAGIMNLAVTLIGDLFSGRKLARAMGYRTTAQNFINATAPFLAGALAAISWFFPFLIYSLAIVVGILVILKLDIPEYKNNSKLQDYFKAASTVIRYPKTLWIFFNNFMIFVLLYSLVVYMPMIITDKFGLSTVYSGLAISVAAGTSGIFATQTGKLKGMFNDHLIVLVGFVFLGLSLLLVAFAGQIVELLLYLVLWGIGASLIMPTLTTAVTEQAPPHLRAGVVSVFSMTIYLGQSVSPPLFGQILSFSDLKTVFLIASASALIPIFYALLRLIKNEK